MNAPKGNGKNGYGKLLIEADMDAVEKRAFRRHLSVIDPAPMPFEQLSVMPFEESAQQFAADTGEDPLGSYEIHQWVNARRHYRSEITAGITSLDSVNAILKLTKQLLDVLRRDWDPLVCSLSMTDQARLLGECKANVSFRIKQLSKKLRRLGQKGFRLPGQKTPAATPTYSKVQQGNSNRRRGKARQMSFLKAFAQKAKAKQKTFTKKLLREKADS